MGALTLDTSALIALQARRVPISKAVAVALADKVDILVPATVLAEFWRSSGNFGTKADVIDALTIVPVDDHVAKVAGLALASLHGRAAAPACPQCGRREVKGAEMTIDATVMAVASERGAGDDGRALLYTSDHDDMARFAEYFPNVQLLGLGGA